MMIPCNYEINVAKLNPARKSRWSEGYEHYCRIDLGDCLPEVAMERFEEIREMFPGDYKLSLNRVLCTGRVVAEK